MHWTEPATAAVLPKSYHILGSRTLASLLKTMASISVTNRNLPKHSATTTGGQERVTEQEIREKISRAGHVDVMVAIGPNFFFTVTLPCTLWFFDKGKAGIDRAHRDFTHAQLEVLNSEARELEAKITENVTELLEA